MQTYVFTVAVTGEDVQDIAAAIRDELVDNVQATKDEVPADVHVTESVRVTP